MSELQEYLDGWFFGETSEVGVYLAAAKRAEEEGYPEVAPMLRQIAFEEAQHAALVAEKLGKVKSTRENLEMLVKGETNAKKARLEAAKLARDEGDWSFAAAMEHSGYDEGRHAAVFQAFLSRLFPGS